MRELSRPPVAFANLKESIGSGHKVKPMNLRAAVRAIHGAGYLSGLRNTEGNLPDKH